MKDDFEGIALWKGTDDKNGLNQHGRPVKEQPVYYTRDFRGEGISAYDIVDYVFKNVGRNSSFECIREVSNKLSEDPEVIIYTLLLHSSPLLSSPLLPSPPLPPLPSSPIPCHLSYLENYSRTTRP
jgi:hypothetical protein